MSDQPLMPKATAVWLVENTALSFDQIADFCKLHPLEVKAIADGDAAQGIKGLDPILDRPAHPRGDRTRRRRRECATAARPIQAACPRGQAQARTALHAGVAAPGPPQRDSLARAQPSGTEGQPDHAAGRHDQVDHCGDPRPHPLERAEPHPAGPGDARPVLADRSRPRSQPRRQGEAARRPSRRSPCCPADVTTAAPTAEAPEEPREKKPPRNSTSRRCSPAQEDRRQARRQAGGIIALRAGRAGS